jgi:hypothetical protein
MIQHGLIRYRLGEFQGFRGINYQLLLKTYQDPRIKNSLFL